MVQGDRAPDVGDAATEVRSLQPARDGHVVEGEVPAGAIDLEDPEGMPVPSIVAPLPFTPIGTSTTGRPFSLSSGDDVRE